MNELTLEQAREYVEKIRKSFTAKVEEKKPKETKLKKELSQLTLDDLDL